MRVTIIIPAYNVAPYIEECLRSVMRQTYTGEMECLIVDDCGTDGSIAIAEQIIAQYDGPIRFEVLHHEQNRGLSAARNTGTDAATGEYLYYLDSDDEISDDCIERLMEKVSENPEVEMVQGNAFRQYMDGRDVVLEKDIQIPFALTNDEVRKCYYELGQIYVNVWNKLLKRDLIIKNRILCKEGLLYEDNLWIFYLLKHLTRAAFIPDITYKQKKRPNSITTSSNNRIEGENYGIIYLDVLTHLTSGREKEELNYYSRVIATTHIKYRRAVPEFERVLSLCKDKCKQYGCETSKWRLLLSSVLGKQKHGWAIWTFLLRVRQLKARI